MQSKEPESFRSISYDEKLQRAKWFKEDLDKGDGWTVAANAPGYTYWIKTFVGDEVPTKIVYMVDMPFPAKVFVQLLDPRNLEARNDWDKAFVEHEIVEAYPDGGYVTYMRALLSWPLKERSFVLYLPPGKEVDWYGKRAHFLLIKHGWHPSKPEGEDGLVRATNGGNFYVVLPEEKQPEAACRVFGLTNNLYNGWVPKTNMEWMQKRVVPRKFNQWRENMVEGYEKYFKTEYGPWLRKNASCVISFLGYQNFTSIAVNLPGCK